MLRNSAKAVCCMKAFRQVQASVHKINGSANLGNRGNELIADHKKDIVTRNADLHALRAEIKTKGAGKSKIVKAVLRVATADKYGSGNCMEQAYMAGVFLCQEGVTCTIVSVTMGSDKHVFVVADEITQPCDLALLGGTPICDPWMHEKAVVEGAQSTLAYGSGVSTAVKHAAILKSFEYGTEITPVQVFPKGVLVAPSAPLVGDGAASSSVASGGAG